MLKGYSVLIVLVFLFLKLSFAEELNTNSFPDDFLFGVATAAYQVEGGWDADDKGENIWDYLTHNHPELVLDGSNGDIVDDSYHKYPEDVELMKNLGVQFYRFSISWSRLLPTGFANYVSTAGADYYDKLINALVEANIIPLVTLYHWDLPVTLQALGGWANPNMADYFLDYVDVAFKRYGDRVKHWITFNEPNNFCGAYGSSPQAPYGVNQDGIADYMCIHTVLLAHAKAYHKYHDSYSSQNGSVGITLNCGWAEPNSTTEEDVTAAARSLQFGCGLYAHPIFSKDGNHPSVVIDGIANRSELEGFPYSRLLPFTDEEVEYIKGTGDFFGLNYYSAGMCANVGDFETGTPSLSKDSEVTCWYEESWEHSASSWLVNTPWGFTKMLKWIKDQFGDVPIYVTENGWSDYGELEDDQRVKYMQQHLSALLDALEEDVDVRGYAAWSLLDNFEWLDGFEHRLGLHYVNVSDPDRPRTPKKSAGYYKQVIATRKVVTDSTTTEAPSAETTASPSGGNDDTAGCDFLTISRPLIVAALAFKYYFNRLLFLN